jgi:hypothetical protein
MQGQARGRASRSSPAPAKTPRSSIFLWSEAEMRDIAALGSRDGRLIDWTYSGRMKSD